MVSGILLNRSLRLLQPLDLYISGNEPIRITGQRSPLDSKSWKRTWNTMKGRMNLIL
jgi:hypothetical protein